MSGKLPVGRIVDLSTSGENGYLGSRAALTEMARTAERARIQEDIALLERINAAAEADMGTCSLVTGAHHRAIEAELKRLREALEATKDS